MQDIKEYTKSVAIYLRKSRAEENEDTSQVLARHKAELTKFAKANNVNVKRIYEEVASGDSLFCRPQMCLLLKDIESKEYTGVLCVDIDRLGRGNMQEQGLILNTLKNASTAIITPERTYDLNDDMDEQQTEFKTFFARQELKMIKKRLARGVRATIEKGGYVSNVPYGYNRIYKDKTPTLTPSETEAQYVKLIFELYTQGEGCQSIANTLTNMGVKPHRGDVFSRNSIKKILTSPVYIGKIVWGQKKHLRPTQLNEKHKCEYISKDKWLIFDGLHEPIIDEDLYNKANEILKGRYHAPYREANKIVNPLSGILACRNCGKAMTRRTFKIDRKYQSVHILCPTAGCCKSSRLDFVESRVLEILTSELDKLIIQSKDENIKIQEDKNSTMIAKMKSELSKIENQKSKLYDFLEQGVYTIDTFTERESIISNKIGEVKAEIEKFENQNNITKNATEKLIPAITHVLQSYSLSSPYEKNNLLKSVIKRAYYYKDKQANPTDFDITMDLRYI